MSKSKGEMNFRIAPPVNGIEKDYDGPVKDRLLPDDIQTKIAYPDIHAKWDEWEFITESDAQAYLPMPQSVPAKVTLGINSLQTVEVPYLKTVSLNKYVSNRKGHIINTAGAVWGLDFAPKDPSVDSQPFTQYLAISGYKSTLNEHHPVEDIQPDGSYLNCIQLWRCNLTAADTPDDPVLDLCFVHPYGIVLDMKWCPYGAYEEVG
ncbi:hypothetical protein EC973_002375 [Apophysomyces ossiformis]|uniref:Uncharacterized protein n=1 Tax=Apophysomyces ossiformis TaxID=679940 RepID=A0A8H7ER93_9FUNG|nr:hypothetical protein EC973_002375 [Apophysomyces ossiformis]